MSESTHRREDTIRQSLASLNSNEWPTVNGVLTDTTQTDSRSAAQHDSIVLDLTMQPELSWFEGHYPTMPILAGIAQVHIAAGFGCHLFELDAAFEGLDAVKFTRLIEPGQRVDLHLSIAKETVLRFRFVDSEYTYSSGRILFGAH